MNLGTMDNAARAMRWSDLGPAQQAGMRCKEPLFWVFLNEERYCYINDEEGAAEAVRAICGIVSRGDLGKPAFSDVRNKWRHLDDAYVAWKIKENA